MHRASNFHLTSYCRQSSDYYVAPHYYCFTINDCSYYSSNIIVLIVLVILSFVADSRDHKIHHYYAYY